METALVSGAQGLFLGILNLGAGHVIMILVGSVLLYLGIAKGYEPLLLVPIGFGAILVNIPLSEIRNAFGALDMDKEYVIYCQSGRRSSAAAFLLAQRGYNVYVLEGGLWGGDRLP